MSFYCVKQHLMDEITAMAILALRPKTPIRGSKSRQKSRGEVIKNARSDSSTPGAPDTDSTIHGYRVTRQVAP